MPPKQTKKQVSEPVIEKESETIESIQKEWSNNVKEINTIREKLSHLEKHNEELIAKLWDKMNKNPSDQVIIEGNQDSKPKKVETKEVEKDTDSEVKPIKSTKKPKQSEVEKPQEVEVKPVKPATKKTPVKKTEVKEVKEAPVEEKKKAPIKGKITAPTKGTPKPKVVESDDEKPKPLNNDSSSDTEIDSLSSVSSESDASGGEDD